MPHERQRIVLVRGLLRDPALLILDGATRALDTANETAIERLRGKLTIVIITHRETLTRLADRRIVLDRGRVTAVEDHVPG